MSGLWWQGVLQWRENRFEITRGYYYKILKEKWLRKK
jgi:hypothetical protein